MLKYNLIRGMVIDYSSSTGSHTKRLVCTETRFILNGVHRFLILLTVRNVKLKNNSYLLILTYYLCYY